MTDQADKLRDLIHAAPPAAREAPAGAPMILVAGGRAGVGATTVAVNLAAVLSDRGGRVLLVDAAQPRSNLAEIAGVRMAASDYSLSDVLAGRCSVADAIAPGPAGIRLLAPRSCVRRGGRGCKSRRDSPTWARHAQERLLTELLALHNDVDLVMVDVGSSLDAWTRRFWLRAQLVLLVTTPDGAALIDSYAAIKCSMSDTAGPDVRLLLNQCDNDRLAAEAQQRFSSACQRFLGRAVPALPSLPRCEDASGNGEDASVGRRVWEAPDTPFGHAVLWLGRGAVCDIFEGNTANSCASPRRPRDGGLRADDACAALLASQQCDGLTASSAAA